MARVAVAEAERNVRRGELAVGDGRPAGDLVEVGGVGLERVADPLRDEAVDAAQRRVARADDHRARVAGRHGAGARQVQVLSAIKSLISGE